MKARLQVPLLGWVAKLADKIMIPLMHLLMDTLKESPQCTHLWNNKKLSEEDLQCFNEKLMVYAEKVPDSMKSHYVFFFHMPIFGGWCNYIVIEPLQNSEWHVGWKTELAKGVSRIKLSGPVKVLRGPTDSLFFGVDTNGDQIPIREIGRGVIGEANDFSKIKLL